MITDKVLRRNGFNPPTSHNIAHKNYFIEFYIALDDKAQEKVDYVFDMVRTLQQVTGKFLKHIQDIKGLYEIRISHGSMAFRIFCCFGKGNIIILFNGFVKRKVKHLNLN